MQEEYDAIFCLGKTPARAEPGLGKTPARAEPGYTRTRAGNL
jgi:hypothetical protein